MTYGRTQNPTVQMLEERIALMEGAVPAKPDDFGHEFLVDAEATGGVDDNNVSVILDGRFNRFKLYSCIWN